MPNQRLTFEQAQAILIAVGTATEIASRFGVSHQTVRLYKEKKTEMALLAARFLHSEGIAIAPLITTGTHKFTPDDIASIRNSEGTSKEVAEAYGCSASMVRMIRTGKAYV